MSQEHPELLFVAGPQAGQRATLARPEALMGRGGGADIMLSEDFASRAQCRFDILAPGTALENLSANGTWINGRKYKAGKQVILETGDLIGVGHVTEILFVSHGDAPEAALAAYRQRAATVRNAFGKKPGPAQARPAAKPDESPGRAEEAKPPEEQDETRRRRASEMSAGERLDAEARARRKKVTVGLSIYLGVIMIVGIALAHFLKNPPRSERMSPMLKDEEIRQAMRRPVERTPSALQREEWLRKALGIYQQLGSSSHSLCECVRDFKEALAYSGQSFFLDPEHNKAYRDVLEKLTKLVISKYHNACILEKDQNWANAEDEFGDLLRIIGDEKSPVFENVQLHFARVKYLHRQKTATKHTPWI